MKITVQWLKDANACPAGIGWFLAQGESELPRVVRNLVQEKQFSWANWVLVHCMNRKQRLLYIRYSVKQLRQLLTKLGRPCERSQHAVEVASKVIKNMSKEARSAAWSAVESAVEASTWSDYASVDAWAPTRAATWKTILKYGVGLCKGVTKNG